MRCLATKADKIPLIFKYMRIVLPWKQTRAFKTRNLNMSEGLFINAVLFNHYQSNILCFLLKLCQYECGWSKL